MNITLPLMLALALALRWWVKTHYRMYDAKLALYRLTRRMPRPPLRGWRYLGYVPYGRDALVVTRAGLEEPLAVVSQYQSSGGSPNDSGRPADMKSEEAAHGFW